MASILSVSVGDSIVETLANGKKSKTVVTHIAVNVCSKRGVHINRNACYDNTAEVRIERGNDEDGYEWEKMPEEMTDEELDAELTRSLKTLNEDLDPGILV